MSGKSHAGACGRGLAVALIAAIGALWAPVGHAETVSFAAKVVRVVDGDTFRVDGLERSIRIWGLDAPERGESGGSAATRALRGLIEGREVSCRIRDIDRYRRIVGQCFLPDGRDVAAAMIRKGAATEYCRFSKGHYGAC